MMDGDNNQLMVYNIIGFCHTSGTLGLQKYIPMTDVELQRFSNYLENYQDRVIEKYGGKKLHMSTFRINPEEKIEDSLLFTEIYYKNLLDKGCLKMEQFVGGDTLLFEKEPGEMLFAKLWAAFLERDITMIESIFLYDQLHFFGYMEENWKQVIDSMRTGEIPDKIKLSDRVKDYLLTLPKDNERIDEVERLCEEGFDNIAVRLWKNLRLLSGISNKSFMLEDRALNRYARDVSRYYLCYSASECHMGHPMDEGDYRYVLMPEHAFFEFLPYDGGSSSEDLKTFLPGELEIGGQYEIIYTTFCGLYRYRMGDIVKITGYYHESPVMEFLFRKNQFLNIAGEKMGVLQIEEAIRLLKEEGVVAEQYCFGASIERYPGKYIAAIVLEESSVICDARHIACRLDELLRRNNSDYNDLRGLHLLEQMEVVVFDRETYKEFLKENGLGGGHNKPKHIVSVNFSERSFERWKEIQNKRK
jgi:hypothetical protein